MRGLWSGRAWEHFWAGFLGRDGKGWDGYPPGVSVPKLSAFVGKGNCPLLFMLLFLSVRYLLDGAVMGERIFR